ncbi:LutB/LldF family L-lactate oxidation iron-sulfur protein [Kocuria sp. p3-SID1433]|uniref:LutB/LldF family L-lactate oxidation iron-sulfur protein n=1 Tax=unclassified Kocuria TaxID=2649579 RepID=UPI0021A30CE1|nr:MULTISPECIES: LutB/LldF family L-lactate oxidation iron-sulfur protein [unclassified Kocuria]MCT1601957.1 LutB/LldF family L-lactate oxidation iron-sulfur protein [Kocuria sp. p3-SID1428]MCT2180956.1 LutB/LldF family L-lactate oxidation iron-sulfur protein [Kocuria sp. p3-SID1433]
MTAVQLGMPSMPPAYGVGNLYEESPFPAHARDELRDEQMRANIGHATHTIRAKRNRVVGELPDWEELRDAGAAVKQEVAARMPELLEQFEANVTARGGIVHWARDAEEANRIVTDLVRAKGVDEVIKVKSMATQEMGLNEHLDSEGIRAIETDLAELIVQLGEDKPSHILVPAIHKNRDQIREIFSRKMPGLTRELTDEPAVLAEASRRYLREKFLDSTVAISGANFGIAESGTLTVVESEGNGRMCLTLPETLITVMGVEKLLPRFSDLEVFTQLLPRSSTGERMNPYTSMWTGVSEGDGPQEFHLILMDNGRSAVLSDPAGRDALRCIRCSACLNVCPVYEHAGGHAYGSVYPGPIGAILSPQLTGVAAAENDSLPYASSLCGRCYEVCPVKIDIPSILVHLRDEDVRTKHGERRREERAQKDTAQRYEAEVLEQHAHNPEAAQPHAKPEIPQEGSAGTFLRRVVARTQEAVPSQMDLLMRAAGLAMSSGTRMRLAEKALPLGRAATKPMGGLSWMPGVVGGWTQERDIPVMPRESFRSWWQDNGAGTEQRRQEDLGDTNLETATQPIPVEGPSLAGRTEDGAAWGSTAQEVRARRSGRVRPETPREGEIAGSELSERTVGDPADLTFGIDSRSTDPNQEQA